MPAKRKSSKEEALASCCPISWDVFPMDQVTWDTVAAKLNLSPRHKQIVERLLHGQQRKQIVEDLNSTEGAVGQHFKRIYQYHGVSSSEELILRIFKLAIAEHAGALKEERQCK